MLDNFDGIVRNAFENSGIAGNKKTRLLYQAGQFYFQLCPEPTPSECEPMAITLCDSHPQLKDRNISVSHIVGCGKAKNLTLKSVAPGIDYEQVINSKEVTIMDIMIVKMFKPS